MRNLPLPSIEPRLLHNNVLFLEMTERKTCDSEFLRYIYIDLMHYALFYDLLFFELQLQESCSCANHLGGKSSCYSRKKNKSLQTFCSGNGAYEITYVLRTSTSCIEWDAGVSPSVFLCAPPSQGCLLYRQMCHICRNVRWWGGEAGVQQVSHFFIPSPRALFPSCYLDQQGLGTVSSSNS